MDVFFFLGQKRGATTLYVLPVGVEISGACGNRSVANEDPQRRAFSELGPNYQRPSLSLSLSSKPVLWKMSVGPLCAACLEVKLIRIQPGR